MKTNTCLLIAGTALLLGMHIPAVTPSTASADQDVTGYEQPLEYEQQYQIQEELGQFEENPVDADEQFLQNEEDAGLYDPNHPEEYYQNEEYEQELVFEEESALLEDNIIDQADLYMEEEQLMMQEGEIPITDGPPTE